MKLDKIYTRGGDSGLTSLADGSRVKKSSARVNAYGIVDELNSAIGIALCYYQSDFLEKVQNELFDVGAELATPFREGDAKRARISISEDYVTRIENEIDRINANLPPLLSFVLPGGNIACSTLHLARTICRRAEREVVYLAEVEPNINPILIKYINRLSDLIFVMAREASKGEEVLWQPSL